jgi:uncharacterized protein YchJ
MRADEDTYFVMENLRYLLSQYNPEWALWIGEKFHSKFNGTYYLYKVISHKIKSNKNISKLKFDTVTRLLSILPHC